MEKLCFKHNLLHYDEGLVRVPFLIKGRLVPPPEISKEQIEGIFGRMDKGATYIKLAQAQIVREPVIDRKSMKYTGKYVYQVMPAVSGQELIETDKDRLARGLYTLSTEDILKYLQSIKSALLTNRTLISRVREICRLTSEFPDAFLDGWFDSFPAAFNPEAARQMIDSELSFWGKPGSDFLNGWVELPAVISLGSLHQLGIGRFRQDIASAAPSEKVFVCAMPTCQLHITAGNAPEVPIISAMRAVLTKSAAVIKLPYGAVLSGVLFALAAYVTNPKHPITQSLSMVYWQGGDDAIESILFRPNAFNRIVVWGSPETMVSVQSRALFTRIICLNPRYSISLIGREAFSGSLEQTALKASMDVMIHNQKACNASLVNFIEGSEEQANKYAGILGEILKKWDQEMPNFVSPSAIGQIKRMRRGKYANARWYVNNRGEDFSSGTVVIPGEFDILDHPMCRLVIVQPVSNLEEALKSLNQSVAAVSVYPEPRRLELRDRILARGVSNVLPLGQSERFYAGTPHDGMVVLSQLVDWKNG
jgi:hypothetical protein